MDFQTRKLNLIQYLIGLKDDKLFRAIESTIINSQKGNNLAPFSQEQLIDRAKKSSKDYLAGKYKSQNQLEEESENW